jgi:DNA-directed RNA polymerase specialized sigma subunit
MGNIKDTDLELWRKWHTSHASADLEVLMKQMAGPIRSQVNRWTSIVPAFVLENEAKKLALAAFETYNPNMGTALNTHVTTWLQKLSRVAYERQSSLSIPEHKRIIFNQYNRVKTQMEDDFGKPPTMSQMADHFGMSVKKLTNLVDEVGKREYLESEEHAEVEKADDQEKIHLAYFDMTPVQQKIFKMKTGYENASIKSNATIIKELSITQGQLSYELTKIKNHLLKAQGR